MQVIFTQSNETALVKMYATSTVLLRVVHHYFILNHALSRSLGTLSSDRDIDIMIPDKEECWQHALDLLIQPLR